MGYCPNTEQARRLQREDNFMYDNLTIIACGWRSIATDIDNNNTKKRTSD